ncbi:MAG: beta-lactamase family protein [Chlorobia bacterium]|nr:beta-lactamase family protein [Fimbriimonadaceae bacterium]
MRRLILTLLLVASSIARADEIDDMARAEMKASNSPGLALVVVKDGKVLKIGAYGIANLETGSDVRQETVFRVASMSKQFCSAAAMLLVQDGKWKLDDPISKYVGKSLEAWSKITLRHLLTHTSGMAEFAPSDGFGFRENPSGDRYIEMLAKHPLKFQPGEKYEYSNEGYSILGILVGKVAGKPLSEFVAERIFKPVGMANTSYYLLENLVPGRANGYVWDKDHHENAIPLRPYAMAGSGGIQSTVLDWVKWDLALHGESILSKGIKDQIWAPATLNDGKPTTYGFGWSVRKVDGKLVVAHSGGTAGFTSNVVRHVDSKLTVVVFQNLQGGGAVRLSNDIAAWFLRK